MKISWILTWTRKILQQFHMVSHFHSIVLILSTGDQASSIALWRSLWLFSGRPEMLVGRIFKHNTFARGCEMVWFQELDFVHCSSVLAHSKNSDTQVILRHHQVEMMFGCPPIIKPLRIWSESKCLLVVTKNSTDLSKQMKQGYLVYSIYISYLYDPIQ